MRDLRRDPIREMLSEMRRMQREMDILAGRRVSGPRKPVLVMRKKKNAQKCENEIRDPVISMKETESQMMLDIELPGMKKENIKLNVTPRHLEISAVQKVEKKEKGCYASCERKFYKALTLPAQIDPNAVEAMYKNGILHLSMKKKKQVPKANRIQIK